jgi:hypothetical protein
MNKREKIAVLNDICEVVSDSLMPPENYLMLHPDAAIDKDDIAAICDWTDDAALSVMRGR